jgi:aspergillopepsin I
VKWESIADTGYVLSIHATYTTNRNNRTSLWYAPATFANAYWAKVPGASWKGAKGGWTFPCSSKLPDVTVVIAGNNITVPGINMNYQTISQGLCYGGLQRSEGNPVGSAQLHIAGDVFLKNMFVVFEHPVDGQARLGFARQA